MSPMNPDVQILRDLSKVYYCEDLAGKVLNDPRFPLWSGSSKPEQHHYRKGGLAEHVREVVELCLSSNYYFPVEKKADSRKLYLAALFHDAGKMWDYMHGDDDGQPDYNHWTATEHKYKIHHISRSGLVWHEACLEFPDAIDLQGRDEVLHAILSHHGLREWGSPISPSSAIAWLLHLNDSISARLDDNGRGKK